jgi:transglutaminase-like putative cysteine protease
VVDDFLFFMACNGDFRMDIAINGKRWKPRDARVVFGFSRRTPTAPRVLLEHGAIPWLLAVAVATTLPLAWQLPLWLSFLAGLMLLGRAWLWLKNGRLPRRWILVAIVFAGTIGIALQYRSLFGRDPGIALLVFFMSLKPMEMSSRRDGLVVIMLGFFLLLTHYFFSEGVVTGGWLLASVTLLTAALLRMHGSAQPVGGALRYSALLIAQSLPFMLILFVLFPRIPGPLWGMPRDTYAGLSGLSEHMSPGSMDELVLSKSVAFHAKFNGEVPPKTQLYWRGPVFDSYDGRTWRTSWISNANLTSASDSVNEPAVEVPEGAGVDYTIVLEAHNRRWLLALDMPIVLPEDAMLSPTFEVLARRPVRFRARYAFRSALEYTANREESPRLLQQALSLPPQLNPRTRELAESWRQMLGEPEQISEAALRFFRAERFFYTLQPPELGPNAVDEFLFDSRRGFCEHYASAYVVLMRAAGIPARVVAGYQGGEFNPVDNSMTVRQSNAHAWAEIWVEGKGWRRVDPTTAVAPSRIQNGIEAVLPESKAVPILMRFSRDWLTSLHYHWDAVSNIWDLWVLGYNVDRQRETLIRLGMKNPNWRGMASAMGLACSLALLLVASWIFFRRAKRSAETRAWHRFCVRLERFGIRRAPWEGPFDLAARVAREKPELASLTRRAAKHFAELRYGAGRQKHLRVLRACVKKLGEA